jgi:hypothetical protein
MSEQRRSVRQKTFLRGCIHFDGGRKSADCVVRDMTVDGARLTLSDPTSVPDEVKLDVPQKKIMVDARVQWRRGVALGVAFADKACVPAEPPQSNDLAWSVTQLQAEVSALWQALSAVKDELARLNSH